MEKIYYCAVAGFLWSLIIGKVYQTERIVFYLNLTAARIKRKEKKGNTTSSILLKEKCSCV